MHREIVTVASREREELIDVTGPLKALAKEHPKAKLMALFSKGATSAVMVQENWDPNIRLDIVNCLRHMAPRGKWLHDRVDGNADAHIKSGIVGPSETIPLHDGELLHRRRRAPRGGGYRHRAVRGGAGCGLAAGFVRLRVGRRLAAGDLRLATCDLRLAEEESGAASHTAQNPRRG